MKNKTIDRLIRALRTLNNLFRIMFSNVNEIWIGDSHAVYLARSDRGTLGRSRRFNGVWSIWRGARLLYSTGINGISKKEKILLKFLSIKSKQATLFVVHGEIDCRMHWRNWKFKDNTAPIWVEKYIDLFQELSVEIGFKNIIFVGPVPPADTEEGINIKYPRDGSIYERVEATILLDNALFKGVSSRKGNYISLINMFSNEKDHSLMAKFTNDGCHLNSSAVDKLRESLDGASKK
jgi:hypothetical protein